MMKLYIRSSKIEAASSDDARYRCVRKGSSVDKFMPFELGIHLGSLELAQKINEDKYNNSGDIYEVHLDSGCILSNPVSDFEAWNSIEAVSEILSKGFGLDISTDQVTKDFRNREFNKDEAATYIIGKLGNSNVAVAYRNAIELDEDDIIILDEGSISSTTKVQDDNQ